MGLGGARTRRDDRAPCSGRGTAAAPTSLVTAGHRFTSTWSDSCASTGQPAYAHMRVSRHESHIMIETALAQLRFAASMIFGWPFSQSAFDRLIDAALATRHEFGTLGAEGSEG